MRLTTPLPTRTMYQPLPNHARLPFFGRRVSCVMGASVTATLTPGRTTTGLWCDKCLSSSRFVIGLYVICEFGPVHVATVNRCRNCDD